MKDTRKVYFLGSNGITIWNGKSSIGLGKMDFQSKIKVIDSIESVKDEGLEIHYTTVKFKKNNSLTVGKQKLTKAVVETQSIFVLDVPNIYKSKEVKSFIESNSVKWRTLFNQTEEEKEMEIGNTVSCILLEPLHLEVGGIIIKQYDKFEVYENLIKAEGVLSINGYNLEIGKEVILVKESVGFISPLATKLEECMHKKTVEVLYKTDKEEESRTILPLEFVGEGKVSAFQSKGFSENGKGYGIRTFFLEDLKIIG